MRRGLATPSMMIQPNRQWIKPDTNATGDTQDTSEEDAQAKCEEELAALDPVQRAARLQAEKLRLEEQEQELARLTEAQENAGRDPTLFSKRTAFDIRFDQMEDKPWLRATDISDFFNYGLDEEGWLAYAQQQMTVRQELIDAQRMKRTPDPTIVPVTPKAPAAQGDRVAVNTSSTGGNNSSTSPTDPAETVNGEGASAGNTSTEIAGPALPQNTTLPVSKTAETQAAENAEDDTAENVGVGGAWAVPEATLARLLQEQEQQDNDNTAGGYDHKSYQENDGRASSYSDDRQYDDGYSQQQQQQQRYHGHYGGGDESSGKYDSYSGGGRGSQEGQYSSQQESDYGGGRYKNDYYQQKQQGYADSSNYGNDHYGNNSHSEQQDDGYNRSRGRGPGGRPGRGWDNTSNGGGDHYHRKRNREWRR